MEMPTGKSIPNIADGNIQKKAPVQRTRFANALSPNAKSLLLPNLQMDKVYDKR